MKKYQNKKNGGARRLLCALLAVSLVFAFSGCKKDGTPQPAFPLEQSVVSAALEQTGLPGGISETETISNTAEHISYVLRDPVKTYGDSENKLMTATISSAITEGERFLQIIYLSPYSTEKPAFAWEDRKQQMLFAALLYGGFEDDEELYRVFFEQEMPEATVPPIYREGDKQTIEERLEWDAKLPSGYCRVRYTLQKMDPNFNIKDDTEYSPTLSVTIYESEALYQKQLEAAMEAQQKSRERQEAIESSRAEVG